MILVTIPGNPQPQGRGRIARTARGPRIMDPEESRSWKGAAQVHMVHAMRGLEPLTGPVLVAVVAVFACPRSDFRKTKPRPLRWCSGSKGDWDNIAKAACDAANGILWRDDAQVALGAVLRLVGAQGDAPRVEIAVAELLDEGGGPHHRSSARRLAWGLLEHAAPFDFHEERERGRVREGAEG